ncbi:MAG: FAD-dependent oxidoreductase [Clostridiales bacterium]|nr:FAD-dependent oxidoreductase [Clostridiales bacterium]
MSTKRIVILGAGYGGLQAAKTLNKHLRKHDDVDIMLIDQNNYHTLLTELHEVAGNRVEPGGVRVSIEHVLEYTKVKFIQDQIVRADLENRKLYSNDKEYNFDYLILGIGSEPAYFNIEGMKEHAFPLWSLSDAIRIHDHIINMFKQAAEEKDAEKRKEILTFVVGGGGFTGVEMMGELIEWTNTLRKKYDIPKEDIRLIQVEALSTLVPILDKKLIAKVEKYLKKKGVEVLTNSPITAVSPNTLTINNDKVIPTRTVIWTGGIKAKSFVKDLGLSLGPRDRIIVNQYLQTKEYPNVYAIGDNMEFQDEDGKVLPPLVETAMQSADCAAYNVAAHIKGREQKKLEAKLHGVMVSVGSLFAVAQLSGMPLLSGLPAIIIKHLVNMHYLFGIGGLELVWEYMNHQFFQKSREYNWLLETGIGHISRRNFTFWLVPLRIWLGVMWLVSGIQKIQSDWLGDWVLLGLSGATDATSSASITPLIGPHSPGWYVAIAENIIMPNALLFQKLIVITEIGLSLAFIFGFFTFIAAIVSIGMHINFALGAGLPQTYGLPDLWWIAASFAMFAGAGRSFCVDYYLMPFLRNQLRYFQKNRSINRLKGWKR